MDEQTLPGSRHPLVQTVAPTTSSLPHMHTTTQALQLGSTAVSTLGQGVSTYEPLVTTSTVSALAVQNTTLCACCNDGAETAWGLYPFERFPDPSRFWPFIVRLR